MQAQTILKQMAANIETVIRGQADAIRWTLAAFVSGGHVLLEDNPGTGKTTLAKALARSANVDFSRIQFTPDLLPSDILGVSIFDPEKQAFRFHNGPIFTQILLADEINRASPRTQSALLESMAENQVSVDGKLSPLDELFFVIATQNPVDASGTYPLPEAQMDRFSIRFSLGYIPKEEEIAVLTDQHTSHPLERIQACVDREELVSLRKHVRGIRVSEEIKAYIVNVVSATRSHPEVATGASPRASLALMKIAQALAATDGLEFVLPDHVQDIAVAVIAHRIVLDPQARFSGQTAERVVMEILESIPAPS